MELPLWYWNPHRVWMLPTHHTSIICLHYCAYTHTGACFHVSCAHGHTHTHTQRDRDRDRETERRIKYTANYQEIKTKTLPGANIQLPFWFMLLGWLHQLRQHLSHRVNSILVELAGKMIAFYMVHSIYVRSLFNNITEREIKNKHPQNLPGMK